MNKQELVDAVAAKTGATKARAAKTLNALVGIRTTQRSRVWTQGWPSRCSYARKPGRQHGLVPAA
jgi:hypothetical protein